MNSYILIKSKFKINDIILKLKQINVDIYLIYTEKGYTFAKITMDTEAIHQRINN